MVYALKSKLSAVVRFSGNEQGSVITMVACAMPVVIGGLALSIDTGLWYTGKRQVQQQADAAALGVAQAISSGTTSKSTLQTIAQNDAARNGATPGSLSMNWPPVSGAFAGDTTAIEVVVQRQMKSIFAQFFGVGMTTVQGRAVARTSPSNGSDGGCVLALHTSASQALLFQGSGTVKADSCTLVSNSKAADAVYVGGSETLTALAVVTAGGMQTGSSAHANVTTVQTHTAAGGDPYADLATPTAGTCTYNNYSNTGGGTASPGVYCGGMSIGGSKTLTLTPGTYVMKGGDFKVTGSAIVTCPACTLGKGITIVLAPGSNGAVGTVTLGGSTSVQFPAPSASTMYGGTDLRGIAFLQDRGATAGNAAKFDGSGNLKISGAIYMPQANITWIGTSDLLKGYACVEIIGLTVSVQGNSKLVLTDCAAMGVLPVKVSSAPTLLE